MANATNDAQNHAKIDVDGIGATQTTPGTTNAVTGQETGKNEGASFYASPWAQTLTNPDHRAVFIVNHGADETILTKTFGCLSISIGGGFEGRDTLIKTIRRIHGDGGTTAPLIIVHPCDEPEPQRGLRASRRQQEAGGIIDDLRHAGAICFSGGIYDILSPTLTGGPIGYKTVAEVMAEYDEIFNTDIGIAENFKDTFKKYITTAENEAAQEVKDIERNLEYKRNTYAADHAVGHHKERFKKDRKKRCDRHLISTGWPELDTLFTGVPPEILPGGLFPGLYIIGATSSFGKSAFCLQLAESIAAQRVDVLYFTLEMGQYDMIARGIMREIGTKLGARKYAEDGKAKYTLMQIMEQDRFKDIPQTTLDSLFTAEDAYFQRTKNLYFITGRRTAEEIKSRVQEHVDMTGRAPVVVVDYLQILEPADSRASDKQNTDTAINTLKVEVSEKYQIPIIVISAFNRNSYGEDASFAALKESGSIEYGADYVVLMQPAGVKGARGNSAKIKLLFDQAEDGATVTAYTELKIDKARNAPRGKVINFAYHKPYGLYEPTALWDVDRLWLAPVNDKMAAVTEAKTTKRMG